MKNEIRSTMRKVAVAVTAGVLLVTALQQRGPGSKRGARLTRGQVAGQLTRRALCFLGGPMSGLGKYLRVALVISFCSTGNLWAQATAQISGTAKDQSGAVLPGVEIRATQTDTGITRDAVTNETGSYVLQNLPIGPYRLEATLPGFRTYAQTGIVLQVNSSPAVNVVLEVGQVAETVEVQANAALV